MIKDPIIAEIHKQRQEHAASYGHDLRKIVIALREREGQCRRVVLNPGPKYLSKQLTDNSL